MSTEQPSTEQPSPPPPPPSAAAPMANALIERAKNILLKPTTEWDRIAGETTDVAKLYTGYVIPLAGLAALCMAIGLILFGYSTFFGAVHVSPIGALTGAIFRFVMSLVGVYLLALVINLLASSFGSQKDQMQALKLSAYSATASFVASVLLLLPALSMLVALAGIYSLVLLYLGLPRLMKTPEDKRVPYFASIIGVCIAISVVLWMVFIPIALMTGMGPGMMFGSNVSRHDNVDSKITLPNGVTIDTGQARRAAEQMQNAYNGDGSVKTVDPARLAALLPASLPGGFNRVSQSNGSAGAMGGAASAEAEYVRGDAHITVSVVHMGAMSGMAGLVAASGVQGSEENADGYSHINQVDGRTVTEELSRSANTAKYSVLSRNGVAIAAEGQGASMDEVHAAVNAIGIERVEALSPS
ncbi:MAG: Yip1 family protein [Pseudomonadota bacterium]